MAGPAKRIRGHDASDNAGPQRGPLGSRLFDSAEKPPSARGPADRNGRAAPVAAAPAKKPFFIENIPPILDGWGYTMAGSVMRFWQSNQKFQKDVDGPYRHRTRILDHDSLMNWARTKKHPIKHKDLIRQAPWLNDRKDDVINNIAAAWVRSPPGSGVMVFPAPLVRQPPPLTQKNLKGMPFSLPFSNDVAWADAVDRFGLWHGPSSADGLDWKATLGAFLGTVDWKDDLFFTVGNFDWRFLPAGQAEYLPSSRQDRPGMLEVTINEVGVYVYDTFDFNGEQPLGFWNVDSEAVRLYMPKEDYARKIPDISTDPLYWTGMGYVEVTNQTFRRYREVVQNGLDLHLYSEVKFFPVTPAKFMFSLRDLKPFP
jgi:hypothetical protein